jgi:hypothetical protein
MQVKMVLNETCKGLLILGLSQLREEPECENNVANEIRAKRFGV